MRSRKLAPPSITPPSLPLRISLLLTLSACLVTTIYAQSPPPQPVPAVSAPQMAQVAPAPIPPPVPLSPPDGVWLKDESGSEYFLDKLPKRYGQKVDATHLRSVWGIPMLFDREDDDFFYIRYYKPQAGTGPKVQSNQNTPEQRAAIEASYKADIPASNRLTFTSFDKGLPRRGQWREGFAVGDMNEDGHPDLIFSSARKSFANPSIYLSDGAGSWKRWDDAHYPNRAYDYGVAAVADLNHDGHLDVVYGVHLKGIIALLGDGKGNFTDDSQGLAFSVAGKGTALAFSSKAVAIADWDGDGKPDIIALGEGPTLDMTSANRGVHTDAVGLIAYLNRGGSNWVRKNVEERNGQDFGDSIAVKDLDRDGNLDIVTGSGHMGRVDIVHYGSKKHTTLTSVLELHPQALVKSVAIADLNGDGRLDLVIAYATYEETWRSVVEVYFAKGKRQWTRTMLASTPGTAGPLMVGVGHLDGSKRPSIVVGTGDGEVWPFLPVGKTQFSREPALKALDGKCSVSGLVIQDLNGDGRDEIVASFATENSGEEAAICPSEGGVAAWSPGPAAK